MSVVTGRLNRDRGTPVQIPHLSAVDALRMFARLAGRAALESRIRPDQSATSRLSVSVDTHEENTAC